MGGTGWIAARECVRQAYNEICKFDEKEMYFIQFEPVSSFACGNYGVKYRCYDVTKGPREAQYHGKIPYSEFSSAFNLQCLPLGVCEASHLREATNCSPYAS